MSDATKRKPDAEDAAQTHSTPAEKLDAEGDAMLEDAREEAGESKEIAGGSPGQSPEPQEPGKQKRPKDA